MRIALSNLFSHSAITSFSPVEGSQRVVMSLRARELQLYRSSGVKIRPSVGLRRLSQDASRLTVPPMPSQALFPWLVEKKFHSASTLKSDLCMHKFLKFFQFLYCEDAPSLK